MKQYISPVLEKITYDTEECLSTSSDIKKNGKYNLEFDLPEWDEEVI